jgi:hypothetical protein
MGPDEESFVLEFIRSEHRDWRRGMDEFRKEVAEKIGALERSQAAAAAVEQALKEARLEAEYRTQSGSWDAHALQALSAATLQQLQHQKKRSSIPPPARWIASALDTAVGKAAAVAASAAVGALLHYLATHGLH